MILAVLVDAQDVIHRREHVFRRDRPFARILGAGIGDANRLAHAQAAAGEDDRRGEVADVVAVPRAGEHDEVPEIEDDTEEEEENEAAAVS